MRIAKIKSLSRFDINVGYTRFKPSETKEVYICFNKEEQKQYKTNSMTEEQLEKVLSAGMVEVVKKEISVEEPLTQEERNAVGLIVSNGQGKKFLNDKGEYKEITIPEALTIEEKQTLSTIAQKIEEGLVMSENNFTDGEKTLLGKLITNGDGSKFLSDDGTYKIIEVSQKNNPVYKFYQADSGALGFVCESDKKGALVVGGAGSLGSGENLAMATCDELKGLGKAIRFSVRDAAYKPVLFIASNGSYTGKSTNFKAVGLQVGSTFIKIIKYSGSTATLVKTFNFGSTSPQSSGDNQGINITVKHKGNRIEITVIDECRNVVILNSSYFDTDLSNSGDMYGFSNSWGDVSVISNISISNFSGFGTNIILGGDSQQSESYTIAGESITNKLSRFMINHNAFLQNTSVVGRYIQQAIDGFAAEVVPLFSSDSNLNIYNINLGTNDVRSADTLVNTSSAMLARMNSLITAAKNAGFKVGVCTVPVYNLTASQKTEMNAFNAGLRAMKDSGVVDYLTDLFDVKYNIVNQATGTLFSNLVFPDNLHWNGSCREKVAYAMFDNLKQSTTEYMDDTNTGDGSFLGLTKYQITQIAKIDQTFTNAEKTKVTAVNAVGTSVASAATIAVPANKTIFHITGTVEISTINVPYTGFTGSIVVIPDGAFTFATSGNIAEAFTATINRAVEMVYDGVKWYRVGS